MQLKFLTKKNTNLPNLANIYYSCYSIDSCSVYISSLSDDDTALDLAVSIHGLLHERPPL